MAAKHIVRLITLVFNSQASKKAIAQANAALQGIGSQLKGKGPFGTSGLFGGITQKVGDMLRLIGTATAAVIGYGRAWMDLAERGGKVATVQQAFNRLSGEGTAGLQKLREASKGLIADYDLMRQANLAFQLGAAKNTSEFAELVSVSQDLGRALGVDSVKALNDLTIGVGRRSKRILDNLGIIVQGAVTMKSAIEAARRTVDQLGGSAETGADKVRHFRTSLVNLRDALAKLVAESNITKVFFTELARISDTIVLALESGDTENIKQIFGMLGGLAGTAFSMAFLSSFGAMIKTVEDLLIKTGKTFGGPFVGAAVKAGTRVITDIVDAAVNGAAKSIEAQIIAIGAFGKQLVGEAEVRALRSGEDPRELMGVVDPAEAEERRKEEDRQLAALKKLHEVGQLSAEQWNEVRSIMFTAGQQLQNNGKSVAVQFRELKDLFEAGKITFGDFYHTAKNLSGVKLTTEEQVRLLERQAQAMEILRITAEKIEGLGPVLEKGFKGGFSAIRGFEPGSGEVTLADGRKIQGRLGIDPKLDAQIRRRTTTDFRETVKQQGAFGEFFLENQDLMASAAETAANGFMASWETAFSAIGEKSKAFKELELERTRRLAEAQTDEERRKVNEWYRIEKQHVDDMAGVWELLARGFASSVLSGLAQVAGAKVSENIAKALAAVGDGLLGNPGGFAAAAKYTAAAALWGALGGAASAAAGRIAGGGGAGGGFAGGSIAGPMANRDANMIQPIVIVNVDGIDPDNPAHVELVQKARINGQAQWGEQLPSRRRYTRAATRRVG